MAIVTIKYQISISEWTALGERLIQYLSSTYRSSLKAQPLNKLSENKRKEIRNYPGNYVVLNTKIKKALQTHTNLIP